MPPMATVLLVHGAWHGPWMWGALVEEMPDVAVRTVALPSAGRDVACLGDLHEDAAAVRLAVTEIHGPVLVCAHSYGGVPVTEGVADLSNVVGLVYVSGFQLDIGESLAGPRAARRTGGTCTPPRGTSMRGGRWRSSTPMSTRPSPATRSGGSGTSRSSRSGSGSPAPHGARFRARTWSASRTGRFRWRRRRRWRCGPSGCCGCRRRTRVPVAPAQLAGILRAELALSSSARLAG
ncbi:hypothetical protein BJF78_26660 [Pseudonocardia sp. CNS-139]|nr:hypothetical protein BJF78_26660 [Pseudonocardia sp. CNS-139]